MDWITVDDYESKQSVWFRTLETLQRQKEIADEEEVVPQVNAAVRS